MRSVKRVLEVKLGGIRNTSPIVLKDVATIQRNGNMVSEPTKIRSAYKAIFRIFFTIHTPLFYSLYPVCPGFEVDEGNNTYNNQKDKGHGSSIAHPKVHKGIDVCEEAQGR
jgi:hypothetical protein